MLVTFSQLLAQANTTRSNEQLELLVRGWVALAMLAAIGALGLAVIAVLLAVWRRSLARHRLLEQEIQELRSSVTAIGDAWAASATRMGGGKHRKPEPELIDEEDDDDDEEEEEDPFNLFGGRDPLDREEDDDDEDYFEDDDDEDPPPGF